MKLTLWEQDIRDESREEGLEEGRKEGRKKGMEIKLVSQVCRKLAKGKTLEMISEELEEEPDEIRHIANIAVKYAPDYNIEEIVRELSNT